MFLLYSLAERHCDTATVRRCNTATVTGKSESHDSLLIDLLPTDGFLQTTDYSTPGGIKALGPTPTWSQALGPKTSPPHWQHLPSLLASGPASSLECANVCRGPPACLQPLMDYVDRTWIRQLWSPADWSVYGCITRTNNDVEGWHNRLNKQAVRGQLHLYRLVGLLHAEASLITLQMQLVSENKLKRYQRKRHREAQGQYIRLWDMYAAHTITTYQLLKSCSQV